MLSGFVLEAMQNALPLVSKACLVADFIRYFSHQISVNLATTANSHQAI